MKKETPFTSSDQLKSLELLQSNRVAVLGGTGLVGSRYVELTGAHALPRNEADVTDIESLRRSLEAFSGQSLINFAAYTNVDGAEKQRGDTEGSAWKINVEGAGNVAMVAQEHDINLVHLSTDFVFPCRDESGTRFAIDDARAQSADQVSWYGWTKRFSEDVVRHYSPSAAIVRISYPYKGPQENDTDTDLARNIITLYQQDKLYPMFGDQSITPTYIDELVDALEIITEEELSGIYHVASKNRCSPQEFAKHIVKRIGGDPSDVERGSLRQWMRKPGRAQRPISGGLDVTDTEGMLGVRFKKWQDSVDEMLGVS